MTATGALAPLREARFAWFYSARVVSTAGSAMAPVALAFAVLAITDSATALGLVLAARTVPMILFLLVGGVVSDRFSRTAVIRVANLLSGATQAVAALLVITGAANLWVLVALEAVNGTVAAFTLPALQSIVPQLVRREQLQRANALLSFSRSGLTIIGPTVAALLVASVGAGWALAADALSWLVATVLIGRVTLPPMPRRSKTNTLHELHDGWVVFTGNTWLWVVVAGFAVMNGIHAGAWVTLGPTIAVHTFGAQGWGLVLSAESVGLLAMTVVMLRVQLRRPLLSGVVGMFCCVGPLTVLGTAPHVVPLMIAAFVAGAGTEVFSLGWNVTMQENIDGSLLSRASSYDALGSFVAIPVGQLLFGPLGEAFGARPVIIASAAVYALTVLLVLSSRSVRDMRRAVEPANPQTVVDVDTVVPGARRTGARATGGSSARGESEPPCGARSRAGFAIRRRR
ncbi:MFS transporter [Rugosimonospora africana]|uniref:MFS transporter n=1 Tax=Rugosimonospora africana TaxID=556532 RepID=A0A8J3QQE8_9ACTN|nr:MFS transporter [Rugosimonospora africana]GIH15033.1 MFS transporter [Rugosimonospora africana]